MRHFAENRANARFVASLGSTYYFNALRYMDAIVGNSSSGLLEAPTFGLPTVNIGTRQDGRLMAASVTNCVPECAAIVQKLEEAFARGRQVVVNPYGDGHASERIVAALKSITDPKKLLIKHFKGAADGGTKCSSLQKRASTTMASLRMQCVSLTLQLTRAPTAKFQTFDAGSLASHLASKAAYQQRMTDPGRELRRQCCSVCNCRILLITPSSNMRPGAELNSCRRPLTADPLHFW